MSKHKINQLFTGLLILLIVLLHVTSNLSLFFIFPVLLIHAIIVVYGVINLEFNYFFKSYSKGSSVKNEIAITFDDGPCPNTLSILEVLKANKIPATFFCIGKQLEKHPEITQEIVKQGHLIGNHTNSHANTFDFFSAKKVTQELEKCTALIENYTNYRPILFRPPNGVSNPMIAKALQNVKLISIAWNIRTFDTYNKNTDKLILKIKNSLAPGSIILMHDTMPHTVNLVSKLITLCEEEHYKIVSLDKLLNINVYE